MPQRLTNYLLALLLILTSLAHATDSVPASCQTTSPSNFFTYHVPAETLTALGFQTQAQNFTGLTRNSHSQVVYATAGSRPTRLYTIDPPTGQVTVVGATGYDPVVALASHPDGHLWGWSSAGLLQLNPTTGAGTLIDKATNHSFQTLAWQPSGTTLYATAATTSGDPSTLWQWDGKKWQTTCSNLPPQVQGLQARADGLLVLDYRQTTQLHIDIYDATRCQTVARTTLPPLALTVPTSACTLANRSELQAVLDQAQAHDEVIINDWTLPSDSDLTNQDGQELTTYCGRTKSESWIGTGASRSNSYLGLRFHGPALPARAQLLAATLQLTNNHSTQGIATAFEVRAELSSTPAPFLCTTASAPALRPTTSSSGSYAGNDKWMKHAQWPIDVTAPVTDWVRGGFASDTLALIAKGTGSQGGRKFFYNAKKNNLDLKTLPTLTIAYRLPPVVSNTQALQTFLESLAGFDSFQLASDGILTVKLNGQTHRGQLTSQLVAGPPPADGILHLIPLDDRNGDGIADYELLYPSGDRQLAYYLGIEKPLEVLPPDPSMVATPIDPTVASLFDKNIAFLYRGTTPIQTGVAPNTFDPLRVAVIRGQVKTRDQQPLSGVLLTILQHPEVGQTQSRADGGFDLAVNGGGSLTVQYQKAGYLPVQRTLTVPWNDYALVAEVVMTPLDSQVTHLDLTAPTAMQVARGSVVTDDDGTRQATLLFPPGTQATMTLPGGGTQPLTTLDIRATEYTVGATGPQAMPAELPPATGYTYAVEYSVDQAVAAGATRVDFNQPVFAYVDNFLNFPVGTLVPAGWYNATNAAWNASDNGRVIQIIEVILGQAVLDVKGSGQAASETDLAQLGLTAVELQQLAQLYPVGKSLWRVPLTHFSPWDFNFSLAAPPGATAPPVAGSSALPTPDDPDQQCGSVINCQSQVLGETLPVTGTPLTLTYRSERVPGQQVARTLTIPLPGGSAIPAYLGLKLDIQVAGRQIQLFWPPGTAPIEYQFTWDGRDAYGRVLQGQQPVQWRLGYQYLGKYVMGYGFAYRGNGSMVDTNGRAGNRIVTLWSAWQTASLGTLWDARGLGFGGWTLASQHVYSPPARALILGEGSQRHQATILGGTLTTVAQPNQGRVVTVGPDGSVYFQATPLQIHRLKPDGQVELVAGNGSNGCSQFVPDGQPATAVSLSAILTDLQSDAQNQLYLAENMCGAHGRLLRIASGLITTVAGDGTQPLPTGGTERLATTVALPEYLKLAPTPTGNLYVAAGLNLYTLTPAGLLRYEATFAWPAEWSITSLAVAPEGEVYVVLFNSNWGYASLGRLPRSGTPEAVASVALLQLAQVDGRGWLAPQPAPQQVTVDASGTLYFLYDTLYSNTSGFGPIGNKQLLRLERDGRLTTVAGGGQPLDGLGDNGAATAAKLTVATAGLARSPNGTLYLAQTPYGSQPGRLRQLSPALPGVTLADLEVASEDGSEIYHFSRDGRHLRTIDAVTGQTLAQFSYDANGYLLRLTDLDGDVTTIERDANSVPQAIIAPDGQRTTLTVNANGYLTKLTNPAGETYQMAYTDDGLLTQFTTPRGHATTMQYDSLGRLVKEENPVGGGWTLSRTQTGANYEASLTSGEGRTSRYAVERLNEKEMKRVNTSPDGTQSVETTRSNGTTTRLQPDGTVITQKQGPDPRFGMLSPVLQELKIMLPSGLTGTVMTKREATLSATNDLSQPASLKTTMTVNGKSSNSVYTAIDKKVVTTSAAGRLTTKLLDEKGRVNQTSVPTLEVVHYTYDARGRLTQVNQGQGDELRTVTLAYDNSGEVSQLTDALGREVTFVYDAAGRVTTQTLPDGRQIFYSYDANGNVTSITPPSRPQHGFDYTAVDLLSQYLPPVLPTLAAPQTVYAYNLDKQLTHITRPDGQQVTFNYGASTGRLENLTTPLGTQTLSYDEKGRLVNTTTPDHQTLNYTYDGSLPVSETWNGTVAGSLSLAYNNDFRVTTASVNGGPSVTYQYDADGLLVGAGEISLTRTSSTGLLTGTQLGPVTTQRTYNAFGELASETASYQGNILSQGQYTRDKLGRIVSQVETSEGVATTSEYSYDLAGRLVEVKQNGVVTESYEYDANGNRVQALTSSQGLVLGSYDDQDRLLAYGGNTYTYTANGELLTKAHNGQTTTYHYDVLGNLRVVELPGKTIEYVIDGRNRRVGKKVNGTLVQGFLYQGSLKPVAELDGNGNIVARFVYGSKANVPDYLVKDGKSYRLISDHLGSPRLVVDLSDGSVAQRLEYDVFGNVTTDTNPGFQPFGFAGGLYDSETRLVRFGARDYDAEIGRWTSKDPIGFGGKDSNFYQYAFGDPVNFRDTTGKTTVAIAGRIGFGIGSALGSPVVGGIIGAAIGIALGIGIDILMNEEGSDKATDNVGSSKEEVDNTSAQDKKLSNGEIKKLQEAGFDIHDLKGGKHASRYDLYKKPNGEVCVKPKGGRGPGDPLGININDF